MIAWNRKFLSERARNIVADFSIRGLSPPDIAKQYGVSLHWVQDVIRSAPVCNEPGPRPDHARLGMYKGYADIIEPIIRARGVSWAQYMGKARTERVRYARWEAWVALHEAGKPYYRIAKFSMKDHTTIMHGVRQWNERFAAKEAAE